ncbi:hypothetical protein [Acetivibrio mesophilus]|uniref:Uncharacterized protein n=1 Tax=Acetivibrio mesophilus TaxID=2487273 RepID=A0A4Q0I716_9FIRM|nr:hypothetical protein [Acetivibrio mesophilus]ODM27184.1 hypothetical protein A7W90_13730 [Clostridium sp. Bc-iso-3]RXE58782.1 hypothetical protein EFD62_10790 [Acetivibrio mesophilus]
MEFIKRKLLNECIRFIELCQSYVLDGRINVETYSSLSGIKISFIKDMLEREKTSIYFDRDFSRRINELFKKNSLIYEMSKKVINR